jgi:hypothetical protein
VDSKIHTAILYLSLELAATEYTFEGKVVIQSSHIHRLMLDVTHNMDFTIRPRELELLNGQI